ncbi:MULTISPECIES: helix-turn-helix transcriptional regulator [Catenuloplanes]|uniref:ArsR family transcriptional regulator n=1 Tax=Catenuloplanes niger TaxID=587534 RepID=A0AAE3ZSA2_9ACTN|nr:transcriptional regulator [Catenuloplanes niger]MDR7324997.1 putative ArsR family transcriptional regulator [Catenuloplanes niger]
MDDSGLTAVSALTDGVRRAAYREVISAGGAPVGRDEVAAALGVGRTLAAHHLDKLVDAGLLEVTYARRTGRSGPGAGRPAKLYRAAAAEHEVSVPPRAYRTAAELLAEAVERTGADLALFAAARAHGRTAPAPAPSTPPPDAAASAPEATPATSAVPAASPADAAPAASAASAASAAEVLAAHGYLPHEEDGRIELRNCPFHRLAEQFPPLICGMNLAMVEGLLEGGGLDATWDARMDAAPGRCCVTLTKSKNKTD